MEYLGLIYLFLSSIVNNVKSLLLLSASLMMLIIGFITMFAAGGDNASSSAYIGVSIVSFIAAFGMCLLLVIWRIREFSEHWQITHLKSDSAYDIIDQLRMSGALSSENSPLAMADWAGTTLHGADLHDANLSMIGLEAADLSDANLSDANLRSARLENANLHASNLCRANLCYARIQNADLRDTQLADADLTAANFSDALLQGANIQGAHFDMHTTLPDGSHWTPETDMARFTDSTHPKFWYSGNA